MASSVAEDVPMRPMATAGTESADQVGTGTGLAFSGGGIRSAALCSGVLRRLLQRKVEPDYLSCVSGGGYTGTAYLDWKYRNEKKDDPEWHKRFFEQMRSRTGLLCNWQKPLQGILDTVVLFTLVLLVSLFIPIIGWGSFACPLAYFINLAFGKILRAKRYQCQNITMAEDCDFPTDTVAYDRMFLFVVPLVFSVAFYLYSIQSKYQRGHGVARFMTVVSGSLFLYTFMPWFINDYLNNTPAYIKGGAVFLSALLWFFVPFLRRYSSLVIIVYLFAYVVYWRVYEGEILGVAYSHLRFTVLLFVSGLVLFFTSMFGTCHLHLVHVYNRWRLQKAFYTKESRGKCGCAGIGCHDIFPGLKSCVAPNRTDESATEGALNLAHLKGIKPQYISNIVVNNWQVDKEKKEEYGLLTMSPEEIERVDYRYQPTGVLKNNSDNSIVLTFITEQPPKNDLGDPAAGGSITQQPKSSMFAGKLDPGDVKLSEAMAASAAAVSTHMGKYEAAGEAHYRNILTILGLEMGASMVYNVASARRQNCCLKVLPYLIRVLFVIPLLVLPILYFVEAEDSIFVPLGIGSYFAFIVVLSLPGMVNTGQDKGCFENMARWLIVHVPFTSFMRSIFDVVNTGPVPPAILQLSDGGHIENLALLPLLERRLQRIVVVNGGYTVPDSYYGDSLLHALELARDNLNCSFVGLDGRDVLEDIKNKFVNKDQGEQPRGYRFRVDYYDKDKETVKGDGEIILIAPRRPQDSKPTPELDDFGDLWKPIQTPKAVSDLTGCCCECCHGSVVCKCSWCLGLCGVFPQHKTANQFFTPAMFVAYHREGYRACVEAEADEFLGATKKHEHVAKQSSV